MPEVIRDGAITEDRWLPAEASHPGPDNIPTLAQWQAAGGGPAVQLEPGDGAGPLRDHLDQLELVAINFPELTDGRGFSYARELREQGYRGEIRAVGQFMRDQLTYLRRCGCNAFQPAGDANLEEMLHSLADFSESYQAAADQAEPLFRRRA